MMLDTQKNIYYHEYKKVGNKMKINNKGYTLVELIDVIVILGIIKTIMIPTVQKQITKFNQNSTEELKKTIKNGTNIFLSDYRYEITTSSSCQSNNNEKDINLNIESEGAKIENSKLKIKTLVDKGYIKTKDNKIENPENKTQTLDLENSYVTIKYSCSEKNNIIKEINLTWK